MNRTKTIARAGQRSSSGQTLTPSMLQDVASTFEEVGRAPVSFGRPASQQAPKAGNVTGVELSEDGTELVAQLKPLHAVQKEVDSTFFDRPSIAIAKDADGRHYLHHVEAGPMPPAIRERFEGLGLEFSHPLFGGKMFSDELDVTRFSDRATRKRTFQSM